MTQGVSSFGLRQRSELRFQVVLKLETRNPKSETCNPDIFGLGCTYFLWTGNPSKRSMATCRWKTTV